VSRGAITGQIVGLGVLFVALGTISDGLYALVAGSAAQGLGARPRLARGQRWFSASMYTGLGMTAARGSGQTHVTRERRATRTAPGRRGSPLSPRHR
jgi:threonine/homoserine/homoserine lactone efflux protein